MDYAAQHPCSPPTPSEAPASLAEFDALDDYAKLQRWLSTVRWAEYNDCSGLLSGIADSDFYIVAPTATDNPRAWRRGSPPRPSDEKLVAMLQGLEARWSKVAGELAPATQPLAFTGRGANRLLIVADKNKRVMPPWGEWRLRFSGEVERRTFTTFRKAVNATIAPHFVDHIDFIRYADLSKQSQRGKKIVTRKGRIRRPRFDPARPQAEAQPRPLTPGSPDYIRIREVVDAVGSRRYEHHAFELTMRRSGYGDSDPGCGFSYPASDPADHEIPLRCVQLTQSFWHQPVIVHEDHYLQVLADFFREKGGIDRVTDVEDLRTLLPERPADRFLPVSQLFDTVFGMFPTERVVVCTLARETFCREKYGCGVRYHHGENYTPWYRNQIELLQDHGPGAELTEQNYLLALAAELRYRNAEEAAAKIDVFRAERFGPK